MCRGLTILFLLFFPWLVASGFDAGLLPGRDAGYYLVRGNPAAVFCNPAFSHGTGSFHWVAGVHNHHGIRNYNSLMAGIGTSNPQRAFFLNLKSASLSENEYHRTLVNLGSNLFIAPGISAGVVIRMMHFRLPAHYGRHTVAGGMAGVKSRLNTRWDAGLALGYYQPTATTSKQRDPFTHILVEVCWKPAASSSSFALSAETVSETSPLVMATFTTQVIQHVDMMVGVGTGAMQLFAGIRFSAGSIQSAAVSGFNPLTGISSSLVLAKPQNQAR